MKKSPLGPIAFLVTLSALAACASSPPPSTVGGGRAPQVAAPETRGTDYLQTLRDFAAAAQGAVDSNHPVEAIRHLVGLLAVDGEAPAETDPGRKSERAELARRADAQITALGARLTLEPTEEWVVDGKQTTGNIRELAKGTGLRPSVRLVVNYDFGKAVVADAPIRFAFVDGLGELSGGADTDAYGVASTVVRSVVRQDRPAVIRAVLVVSNRGKSVVFKEVSRDFSYLPPSRVARVYAYERVLGADRQVRSANDHSPLVDAVSRGLRGAGLELVPADGALDPAVFVSALGGDPSAVAQALSLGSGRPASFLAVALAECDEPRQMTFQGKTYEIYTTTARTSVRVLRSDGSVVDSRPGASVRGQGGTPEAALQAAFKAAREAVEADLSAASSRIAAALD